jgi:hypothetical protein
MDELPELTQLTSPQLLELHAQIVDELRGRGVVRSSNNPTGDLAEYLFCTAFGWTRSDNSSPAVDAVASDRTRIQIKGRRPTQYNKSRQLSALRGLNSETPSFDVLAAVLFEPNYIVRRAILIPYALVLANSTFVRHTNSWRFLLRETAWEWCGIEDVTETLKAVSL